MRDHYFMVTLLWQPDFIYPSMSRPSSSPSRRTSRPKRCFRFKGPLRHEMRAGVPYVATSHVWNCFCGWVEAPAGFLPARNSPHTTFPPWGWACTAWRPTSLITHFFLFNKRIVKCVFLINEEGGCGDAGRQAFVEDVTASHSQFRSAIERT